MGCNIRHNSCTWTPANPTQEYIDDACIIKKTNGFMVVLGHARNNAQISLLASTDNDNVSSALSFGHQPKLIDHTGTKVQGL